MHPITSANNPNVDDFVLVLFAWRADRSLLTDEQQYEWAEMRDDNTPYTKMLNHHYSHFY